MGTKPRSAGQTATSFSCEETLLQRIDERARSLHMNRSQYIAALARRDLVEGGPLVLHETETAPAISPAKPVNYRKRKT